MSWVSFYDQTIDVAGSAASGSLPFVIAGLTGKRIVFEVSNPAALDTWKTAFNLLFFQELTDFPESSSAAESYSGRVLLNRKTLISSPFAPNPYQAKLLIPYWHQQLYIKIWQETQALSSYNRSVRSTFTQADLASNGVLLRSHDLELSPLTISLWDGNGDRIMPDEIYHPSSNSVAINLGSFIPLAGTWIIEIGN